MVYKWVKIENEKDETYISGKILFWHGYKKYRGIIFHITLVLV